MNKTWTLSINQQPLTLTLALPSSQGYCLKCKLEKEIWIISEKKIGLGYEERKFCWSCSLSNLYELESGAYQMANKKEVIKEIRATLLNDPSSSSETQSVVEDQKDQELLDCNE